MVGGGVLVAQGGPGGGVAEPRHQFGEGRTCGGRENRPRVAQVVEPQIITPGGLSGRVAIGLPPSVAKMLTVPLTREFRQRMPDATLSISEGLSVAMQESLVNGRLDIAVLYNTQPGSEVDISPLLEEDLLLVSAKGQSIRFSATDEALRPMGRATSGVQGMRFNADDQLLSLNVVREGTYLLVATSGGFSKRTAIEEYSPQGRGGKGILTIQYDARRGSLVGALVVDDDSELYAITSGGGVIRTAARQVRKAGRQTKGVRLMNLGEGDTLIAIARNAEEQGEDEAGEDAEEGVEGDGVAEEEADGADPREEEEDEEADADAEEADDDEEEADEHVAEGEEAKRIPGPSEKDGIKIAIIGRPNVGKSTLVNRMLGEERVVVFDQPGTTRDSIYIPFERNEEKYTLIDTAGVRKRGKIHEEVEKFSVVKTMQAIESANVVLLLLDATQGVTDQDAHIAGYALESGRAIVLAVNKWDAIDSYQREQLQRGLPLGQQGDGQAHPLGGGDLAQGADGEFAEQDQGAGQAGRGVETKQHQAQHRAADQHLVADGIEDRAPQAGGVELAGQPAVEEVGDAGDEEGDDGPDLQLQPHALAQVVADRRKTAHGERDAHENKQGHDQAGAGQDVGQALDHG